jgi:hypothetical protein
MSAYLAASSSSRIAIPIAVIASLIAAAATLIVSIINNRSLRWQRDNAAEQTGLMRSGQITDRFMKAVEQLGNENTVIKVGAIFALERIASESPDDRPQIVTTLATFVRNLLPDSQVKEGEYVTPLLQRAPDAQAALTTLCRPPLSDDRQRSSKIGGLDLTRTDLRRANLEGANLRHANLWRAHLEGADLRGANLQDTNLGEANFDRFMPGHGGFEKGTDLREADLSGAWLETARNLHEALLKGAVADSRTKWPKEFENGVPPEWGIRERQGGQPQIRPPSR